jgi:hypothetical protein
VNSALRRNTWKQATLRSSMAPVQLSCEIDGCTATWSVASPKLMKKSMDEHRAEFHPAWIKPDPAPMKPYALDYSGRGRQF